jgi:2-polyprenyl-6-methoxyphenol hydroxylase-like FAD-dependent oxidoreductase
MTEPYDVVVVGGRCAGATLAFHLARAGLSVALVDRARFPSDTISTHIFQTPGIAALERMGLLDEMTATAPFIDDIELRMEDFVHRGPYWHPPDTDHASLCVRRTVLDAALVRAAEEAGAHVRTDTRVTGLVTGGERVTGVTVTDGEGRDGQLDGALVIGADGMGSSVARMVGARRYHVLPNQRFCYWGYFEGATPPGPPALAWQRFADELLFGFPCDDGLYVAATLPARGGLAAFTEDLDGAFAASIALSDLLAATLADARRVGPLRGMATYPLFFRESAGPGWALVGDAGHFKDPAIGQGISDAFRQAERLAADVVTGLDGTSPLDDVLAGWWAWRDADALDMHWLAADVGAAGPVPAVLVEFFRDMEASPGGLSDFLGLWHHTADPADVFTPERFAAAADRLAGTALGPQAAAELAAMAEIGEERARLATSPCFIDDAAPRQSLRNAFSMMGTTVLQSTKR